MVQETPSPSYDLADALRLVPLFYTIHWTPEKKAEWLRITGSSEATTKVLCDHVRSALAVAEEYPAEDMVKSLKHIGACLAECVREDRRLTKDETVALLSSAVAVIPKVENWMKATKKVGT